MRAMGCEAYGGPEVLHWLELPDPHAGPGEVRVRVEAAGVNPIDAIMRGGHFGDVHDGAGLPCVPGMDLVGTIDEAGDGVEGLAVGDRVVGLCVPAGTHGAYSELLTLPVESVSKAPDGVPTAEAGSFLMNALTAWGSLRGVGLVGGETIAVTGAAGALGGYLVQLAHARGARVLASASATDEELVRSFGADVFVDRATGVQGFLDAAPDGVDVVADTAALHDAMLPVLKPGGRMSIYLPWKGAAEPEGIRLWHNIVMRDGRDDAAIETLTRMAEAGDLALRVADTYPMDQAAEAHRRLAEGHLRGRLVLLAE